MKEKTTLMPPIPANIVKPAPAPKARLVQFKSGPFKKRQYVRVNGQLIRVK